MSSTRFTKRKQAHAASLAAMSPTLALAQSVGRSAVTQRTYCGAQRAHLGEQRQQQKRQQQKQQQLSEVAFAVTAAEHPTEQAERLVEACGSDPHKLQRISLERWLQEILRTRDLPYRRYIGHIDQADVGTNRIGKGGHPVLSGSTPW